LGNGFTNLMLMLYVLEERDCSDVEGVVEGDDGLFVFKGTPPTSKDFEELGFVIKLVMFNNLAEASFCGLVFDLEDKLVVTDPREVLASFGWTSGRYARAGQKTLGVLLRCKALALAHQYPGCPVIWALAQYGLRVTRDVKRIHMYRVLNSHKAMSGWDRDQILEALRDESRIKVIVPPINTRFLVERLYGISVEEQLYIERSLLLKEDREPIKLPLVVSKLPVSWTEYWDKYVGDADDERRPCLSLKSTPVQLPCVRRGDWLVPPDYRGRVWRLRGPVMDLTTRARLL